MELIEPTADCEHPHYYPIARHEISHLNIIYSIVMCIGEGNYRIFGLLGDIKTSCLCGIVPLRH